MKIFGKLTAVALITLLAGGGSFCSQARTATTAKVSDLYGLYYVDLGEQGSGETGLVISPDGKPIPPKLNDSEAPTEPGLHVNGRHFKFAWSRFTPLGFAFRTVGVNGIEYSFQGKFGREEVDAIPDVPYLAGVLTEKRNSRVVQRKKSAFWARSDPLAQMARLEMQGYLPV